MSADYPISYLLQVEGDSEVKSKLAPVDNAFADNTAAAEQGAEAVGADIQVYEPFFGSQRISDTRIAIQNYRPATVDTNAYNSIFHAGNDSVLNELNSTITIDSEGQSILKKAIARNSDVKINVNNIN